MSKNQVWSLQKLPPGRKAVRCKWIYKFKEKANGERIKAKSRLVAMGFTPSGRQRL